MKEHYIKHIATILGVKAFQVENCIELLEDGCTVPFISRYRKERTGGLDDVAVSEIKHWSEVFDEMEKRKATILSTIEEAGALTDELKTRIELSVSSSEIEDLYLPYRPKRKTRASIAIEKGFGPLADAIWNCKCQDPEKAATAEGLSYVRDIIAEKISETPAIRENLRAIFRTRRIVSKKTSKADSDPEASKYRTYFQFTMPLEKIPSHNLLAILRAENEGFLKVDIDADPQRCCKKIFYDFTQEVQGHPSFKASEQIKMAIEDSFKRLLEPSISRDVLREAKEKADLDSVRVFGDNLSQLLLAPPVGGKRTMAIDPGFRTGCKVVCLDENGNLLHYETIFPHPPASKKIQSITAVTEMAEKYRTEVIAIGNGTAGRETEDFVKRIGLPDSIKVFQVSEDGASIYSASDIGREEFPDEDVTVRGAVSIGRRLMDPLSELVKIDPKSLGIGQYQHDVDQNLLRSKLDDTVEHCVNLVGVNLNTASPYLLQYVSGIGPSLAKNIIAYRNENGDFSSRTELNNVPRLGAKAFEQCAGFLRIRGGSNPLDNSAVHPEAYALVGKMARDIGTTTKELIGNKELIDKIAPERYIDNKFGLPTILDILKELLKPGLDPREQAQEFSFAEDVRTIEDLYPGMELPGIVTNITNFGAFVDIGLHENGLIHASRMGVRAMADPSKVLKLRQRVKVRVLSTDLERMRISLELIL